MAIRCRLDNPVCGCQALGMKNLALSLLFLLSHTAAAATAVLNFEVQGRAYSVDKLTDGHGIIWGMEFLTPTKMIFTELTGRVHVLDLETGTTRELKNVPQVHVAVQGGLLDVAVHPDFKKNNWVYVTYAKRLNGQQTLAMARAKLDLSKEEFGPWTDLFVARPTFETSHHYGSRMSFDGNGHLFLTVGDRGNEKFVQSLETHNGKVIRLKDDGSVPADNPFVRTPKALKEIWSYGHRNPQGLFFDQTTGVLYEQEHGPMGGDEINVIVKGKNYGWPLVTFGREYSGEPWGRGETSRPGLEAPIKYWIPSIAPSGLLVYRSSKLPLFRDRFVSGALALQHLNVVDIKDCLTACEDRLLMAIDERIRDVIAGPDGLVYVASDKGRIYRIQEGAR